VKFYEDKTYLKMCEKAEEIQQPFRDYFLRSKTMFGADVKTTDYYHALKWYWFYSLPFDKGAMEVDVTLIPRGEISDKFFITFSQDQLQEMVDFKGYVLELSDTDEDFGQKWSNCKWGIGRVVGENGDIYYDVENCGSPEEAFLQFVMKVKFNKTWNGEDWI